MTYRSVAQKCNRNPDNFKRSLDDLKEAIIFECHRINTESLKRVKHSFLKRIDACVNAEDEQFEHLEHQFMIMINEIDIHTYFYEHLYGARLV